MSSTLNLKVSKTESKVGDKTFLYINVHGFEDEAHQEEIYKVIQKAIKTHNISDFDMAYEAIK